MEDAYAPAPRQHNAERRRSVAAKLEREAEPRPPPYGCPRRQEDRHAFQLLHHPVRRPLGGRKDGELIGRYDTLVEADAAAIDLARADRREGHEVDVYIERDAAERGPDSVRSQVQQARLDPFNKGWR